MTTPILSRRRALWRGELARPSQVPPEKYDVWTLWADRGWGKSRAALEEILRLGETTTTYSPMGPRPGRIGVFTQGRDQEDLIMQMLRQIIEGDFSVSGCGRRMSVQLQSGVQLYFWRYGNIEAAQSLTLDHFLLEDIEKATFEQREEIYRLYHQAARWHHDARLIQTCYVMPNTPPGRVAGNRRHLTVGPDAVENDTLTPGQLESIREATR